MTDAPGAGVVRTRAIATYAVGVIGATFVEAIFRLGVRALDTIAGGLEVHEYVALVGIVVGFTYLEGHRALARRFVPSVVARAFEEARTSRGCIAVTVSPLAALGLIGAERVACLRAWAGVAAIVFAVVAVRTLPAPWRGLVDAGVACALGWGLVALVVTFVRSVAALGRVACDGAADSDRAPSRTAYGRRVRALR